MLRSRVQQYMLSGFLVLTTPLACGDSSPTQPTRATVAGTYTATSFTTTSDGETTNQLSAGASLRLGLSSEGTTSGRLIVPGGDEDGGALDADMSGTWTLTGSTVRFIQGSDTFVRDMDFQVVGKTLVGDHTFETTRIQVTLTNQ